MFDQHQFFMRHALKEAQYAFEIGEVPVGAVVVLKHQIIARAHNLVERLTDPTAHAEMQAITSATNYLNSKYLNDCTLYVTLEPCVMCAGAIYWAKLKHLVFGASDPLKGFIKHNIPLHSKCTLTKGILADEATELLNCFFADKRNLVQNR